MPRRAAIRSRRALTLLELMLALSLSVMVVIAIGMAIHLNLRILEARRAGIERTQVARAILQLMANDLRSAVQYVALEFESVEALEGAEALAESAELLEDAEAMLDGESAETMGLEEEEEITSTGGDVVSSTKPGLLGYQYELHVDVSRLPRPDQYEAAMTSSSASGVASDILSDVKTVSYYLQPADGSTVSAASPATTSMSAPGAGQLLGGAGLIRRELDRAVTAFAMEQGDMMSMQQQAGQVVADEVAHIEFLYFDGLEWLTQWDSDEMQSLPLAVEIRMLLLSSEQRTPDLVSTQMQAETVDTESWYRMVVHLPAADPLSEDELAAAEEEEGEEDQSGEDASEEAPAEETGGQPTGGAAGPGGGGR